MRNTTRKLLKVAKKMPFLKNYLIKLKAKLFKYVDSQRSQQEIFNLHSFYPSIVEYHTQQVAQLTKSDPLISILLPTYNTPEIYLRECIESILIQSYSKWELCIADDCSTDPGVVSVIKEYQAKDKRIKLIVREKNGHISQCTNSALELASGDFIALMDHDDVLWPNALYEVVETIRQNPKVDHIYTDEDKIDGQGTVHSYPFLKPDLSPEFLESCNYITHFSCVRMSIMKQIGGFRAGYEGAQDWDLFIRITEITSNIIHIPKLLYSWRVHEASTASNTDAKPYVYEAQKKLLEDHVSRQGVKGVVKTGIITQHRTIGYDPLPETTLTFVIDVTSPEMTGRFARTTTLHEAGVPIRVIYYIKDANEKPLIQEMHEDALRDVESSFVVKKKNIYVDIASECKDEFLAFVIDTAKITGEGWASTLLAEIQRPKIGFVGPVILKNGTQTILSAGVGLGYGSGALNMLEGMPFDDPHYTRGLYAKSRRNVTALSDQMFGVSLAVLKKFVNESATQMMYDASRAQYRNVYTPYIQVSADAISTPSAPSTMPDNYEDPMLNPHFKKDNPRMEVKP